MACSVAPTLGIGQAKLRARGFPRLPRQHPQMALLLLESAAPSSRQDLQVQINGPGADQAAAGIAAASLSHSPQEGAQHH